MRPEAVDRAFVTAMPQQPADPERGPHEDEVLELVEIPFVGDELVDRREHRDETAGSSRVADVIVPRNPEPEQHCDRWRELHPQGRGFDRLTHLAAEGDDSAPVS